MCHLNDELLEEYDEKFWREREKERTMTRKINEVVIVIWDIKEYFSPIRICKIIGIQKGKYMLCSYREDAKLYKEKDVYDNNIQGLRNCFNEAKDIIKGQENNRIRLLNEALVELKKNKIENRFYTY